MHIPEHTLMSHLGMELIELSKEKVVMRMPVDERTHQPYGILHGGASVALAETVASIGTQENVDSETQQAVGIEINANHMKSVHEGSVTAVGIPLHRGRTTMVWDVRLYDDNGTLICISRCTVGIIQRRHERRTS
ncbi:hotdog fold thioesterase [Alicyclobacillus tolerans]|uniref:Uncharacterized protein (TIGR00369 family) n=2 Tax=Alicyclobacillus tolerans TaxID=90970 RepID=A0ABT9LTD9_9BACL|nr:MULTISPECIES: hotdog fold thioesterase [Alicyclobacillus]MDP9727518.1 uncharacterized protein (TIGR00369 family) [Alicyclobacillus tengchongensis]QRF23959.1 hotdog fold thioesterase [Alicyclobacillus sp. TC]SHJ68534.1 uncharacterized domain 1-containing protein [Alicyclobacillus montanus]